MEYVDDYALRMKSCDQLLASPHCCKRKHCSLSAVITMFIKWPPVKVKVMDAIKLVKVLNESDVHEARKIISAS